MSFFAALIFFWAFAEASVWFIAADIVLIPLCIAFPGQWKKWTILLVIGSCLGGTLHYALISRWPDKMGDILNATPFVNERMKTFVRGRYTAHGEWGALWQAWSFISLKIWTYEAFQAHLNPYKYFPIVVFSRLFRFFPEAIAAAYFGNKWGGLLKTRKWLYLVLYVLSFIGGLILIESR